MPDVERNRLDSHAVPTLSGPVTRRRLLERSGVMVLTMGVAPGLLAACGGSDETTTATSAGVPPASGTIDFLSWEGYDLPDQMKTWKEKNNVDVKSTYIASQNDVQAKLRGAGANAGYDLITYYQAYKPLYTELDLLEPLDPDKLPNLKNLIPFFGSDVGDFWKEADGTWTGVPLTWGGNALTYDASVIKSPPESYDILFEPQYTGKVAVSDDAITVWALAAHIVGVDPERMTDADFDKVTEYLSRVIAQSRGVSPSWGDVTTRLVQGDAVVCFPGWSAVKAFAADSGKDTIENAVPKEGGVSFTDIYAIPTGSDNQDTAYAWINETLEPKIQAAAQNYLIGGTVVEDAVKDLTPEIRDLYPYDNIDAYFDQVPLSTAPPTQSDQYKTFQDVIDAWQELKGGAS